MMRVICNGEARQLPEGTTIAELLAMMDLQPQRVAVEVNLELVPRQRHMDYRLSADDRLEVVTLVGGG